MNAAIIQGAALQKRPRRPPSAYPAIALPACMKAINGGRVRMDLAGRPTL
jgi:hypothetical protein